MQDCDSDLVAKLVRIQAEGQVRLLENSDGVGQNGGGIVGPIKQRDSFVDAEQVVPMACLFGDGQSAMAKMMLSIVSFTNRASCRALRLRADQIRRRSQRWLSGRHPEQITSNDPLRGVWQVSPFRNLYQRGGSQNHVRHDEILVCSIALRILLW